MPLLRAFCLALIFRLRLRFLPGPSIVLISLRTFVQDNEVIQGISAKKPQPVAFWLPSSNGRSSKVQGANWPPSQFFGANSLKPVAIYTFATANFEPWSVLKLWGVLKLSYHWPYLAMLQHKMLYQQTQKWFFFIEFLTSKKPKGHRIYWRTWFHKITDSGIWHNPYFTRKSK